jgi:DNA polymerase III delta prime subunit
MLLLLSGKARVGKDTFGLMLAEELQKETGQAYIMMSYAHELKIKIQKDFDLSYEQLFGDEKEIYDLRYSKKRGPLPYCVGNRDDGRGLEVLEERQHWTAREIMQDYGQFFRTIDYDFWVKLLFNVIEEKEYKNVIITDGRHKNEVDVVVDRGGYHIRVERGVKDNVHNTQHISETALDKGHRIDFMVKNYGTLEDLRTTAKNVVRFLIDSEKILNKLGRKGIKNGSKKEGINY